VLIDCGTPTSVIIDPVLESVDSNLSLLRESGIKLTYILETHLHAVTSQGRAIFVRLDF
jgi:sulfur dioxygenase